MPPVHSVRDEGEQCGDDGFLVHNSLFLMNSPAKLQNSTTKHPRQNHEKVAEGKSLKIVSEISERIVKKIGRER